MLILFLPFRRRRDKTCRPALVAILLRNPCRLLPTIFVGVLRFFFITLRAPWFTLYRILDALFKHRFRMRVVFNYNIKIKQVNLRIAAHKNGRSIEENIFIFAPPALFVLTPEKIIV